MNKPHTITKLPLFSSANYKVFVIEQTSKIPINITEESLFYWSIDYDEVNQWVDRLENIRVPYTFYLVEADVSKPLKNLLNGYSPLKMADPLEVSTSGTHD